LGKHTPHVLGEALSWHERYLRHGTMRSTGTEGELMVIRRTE
jgi:hypothetical protein